MCLYILFHLGNVQHSLFSLQVVYFTAIFPFVVLIILFFRGVTLDNASEGIYYFIVPDFNRLLDAQVYQILHCSCSVYTLWKNFKNNNNTTLNTVQTELILRTHRQHFSLSWHGASIQIGRVKLVDGSKYPLLGNTGINVSHLMITRTYSTAF